MAVDLIAARSWTAAPLWLFLDYDGTLAAFSHTPADVRPVRSVIGLMNRLAAHPQIRVAVISGRRLNQVEKLLPVDGIWLAGTYGIELRLPGGIHRDRLSFPDIRRWIQQVKPIWETLLIDRKGFYLEDKGWSLAIHARRAQPEAARVVLAAAQETAEELAASTSFRVLGGDRFLEIAPELAHKGEAVRYLLETNPWPGAMLLFIGDDDKDEEAFGEIQDRGGVAIRVCRRPCQSQADGQLKSPQAVRRWLNYLERQVGSSRQS